MARPARVNGPILVASRNANTRQADLLNGAGHRALQYEAAVLLQVQANRPLDLSAHGGPVITFTEASYHKADGTVRLTWALSDPTWEPGAGWIPTYVDSTGKAYAEGQDGTPVYACFEFITAQDERVIVRVELQQK